MLYVSHNILMDLNNVMMMNRVFTNISIIYGRFVKIFSRLVYTTDHEVGPSKIVFFYDPT